MERYLIANRAEADIYKYSKEGGFESIKHFKNPLGHLKDAQMRTDRPGKSRGTGAYPHTLDRDLDESEQAAIQFAKTISHDLSQMMDEDSNLEFQIVADPSFIGKINLEMLKHPHLQDRIQLIEKNIINVPQQQWPEILNLPQRPRVNHFVESVDLNPK